ncbi:unnamed protein product [Sympodiomycopsis kandeliae]
MASPYGYAPAATSTSSFHPATYQVPQDAGANPSDSIGSPPRSSAHPTDDFHFSTQFRKGSLTADSPYPSPFPASSSSAPAYPPATSSDQPPNNTPSSYYTHLSSHATLRALSPNTGISIDPQKGLASISDPQGIRSRLPWSTVTKDRNTGQTHTVRGYNEFAATEPPTAISKLIEQLKEPLILLLLGSAVVSLLLGETEDAVSIVLAVGIVVAVAFIQERKSSESLEALTKLVPHYCHLIRDGVTSHVLANELVPGDIVTFSTGDRIPADLRIIEAVQLQADESSLTGETKPSAKAAGTVLPEIVDASSPASFLLPSGWQATAIGERNNIAFMGTLVKSGYGKGVVIATGPQTEFGAIFSMVDEVTEKRTPLQLSMDDLAQKLSMISFVIIGAICLIGLWQRRNALEMFTIGVSLAVAAIPEGLPIVVTVTLALGVQRMSHRKAIVKRLVSVETLGSVSVVCSDKTGTLTTNKMTVCRTFTLEDGVLDLTSREHIPHSQGKALSRTLLVGNLCNNSHRDEVGQNVGQPTDVAMANVLRLFEIEDKRPYFKRSAETAFTSENKYMSVTGSFAGDGAVAAPVEANIGNGEVIYLKGALEAVLDRCSTVLGSNTNAGSSVPLDEKARGEIRKVANSFASEGLRVLACATGSSGSETSSKMTFCGLQAMQDPPRPGVYEAITALRRSGVQVIMITGDSEITASAIAKQLGMIDSVPPAQVNGSANHTTLSSSSSPLMTGKQIDALSERQLQEAIGRVSIFARTTPRHKMDIVKALQANGAVVGMTGDGVNDAPALKMADIGIALGAGGTDVAKEASDVILVDDNFATILAAVEEGKGIFYNIQNFLCFQLSTAVAALSLITLSTVFGLKLPLNPMQILFINILMDGPPSQSLGVDPVDREVVMKRKPRRKNASIITKRLLARVLFSAGVIVFGTLYIYISELTGDGFADARDQTMTFTCFVLLDLTSALQNRGLTTPMTGNRMLITTVSVSFVVQMMLIYVPFLQGIFQTTSLGLGDLIHLLFIALFAGVLHEVRRFMELRWRIQGKGGVEDEDGENEGEVGWAGRLA